MLNWGYVPPGLCNKNKIWNPMHYIGFGEHEMKKLYDSISSIFFQLQSAEEVNLKHPYKAQTTMKPS